MENWANLEHDLILIERIVEKYCHQIDTDSMPLYATVKDGEMTILTNGQPWLEELYGMFVERYGELEASFHLQKALSAFIRQDETVH